MSTDAKEEIKLAAIPARMKAVIMSDHAASERDFAKVLSVQEVPVPQLPSDHVLSGSLS